jgi:mycofactocin precursor peptide peptidase
MKAELAALTWPQAAGDSRLLVVPAGSLEQHGPHLPLDTDMRIAMALAGALGESRSDVVIAPPVPYGASGEHEGFPGTVSVGREGLALFLLELLRSASATYRRILVLNGHGGNAEPVSRAVAQAQREGRDARAWTPRIPGGDLHAGRAETSMMLAIHPAAVLTPLIAPGTTLPAGEIWPRLRAQGVRAVSGSGVLGDPTGASAAEGRAMLARLAAELGAFTAAWCDTRAGAHQPGRC